jgi:hypothetical protein
MPLRRMQFGIMKAIKTETLYSLSQEGIKSLHDYDDNSKSSLGLPLIAKQTNSTTGLN